MHKFIEAPNSVLFFLLFSCCEIETCVSSLLCTTSDVIYFLSSFSDAGLFSPLFLFLWLAGLSLQTFLRILNKQFGSQTVNMLFKFTGTCFVKHLSYGLPQFLQFRCYFVSILFKYLSSGLVRWTENVSNGKELWIARRKHQHLHPAWKDH